MRITPNQDILICDIQNKNKTKVNEIEKHALACPALPLCGLAITEAERILPEILRRIESMLIDLEIKKTILFRMTGCPNGCSRPYMAELALVGSGSNQYQVCRSE